MREKLLAWLYSRVSGEIYHALWTKGIDPLHVPLERAYIRLVTEHNWSRQRDEEIFFVAVVQYLCASSRLNLDFDVLNHHELGSAVFDSRTSAQLENSHALIEAAVCAHLVKLTAQLATIQQWSTSAPSAFASPADYSSDEWQSVASLHAVSGELSALSEFARNHTGFYPANH